MLTLDGEQLSRQKRTTRFRENQHRNRETLLDAIERKTITVAKDGDIVTTNLDQQLGTPLSEEEFCRRLRLMNRNFLFEVAQSDPDHLMGIYVVRNERQSDGSNRTVKRYVCGMTRGFMPERTVRHAKRERMPDPDPRNKGGWVEVDVFTKETRGWRTVLVRLLRERLITQPQIDRYFPPNLNSRHWQRLTN